MVWIKQLKVVGVLMVLAWIVLKEFLYINGEILACRNVMGGMGLMLP